MGGMMGDTGSAAGLWALAVIVLALVALAVAGRLALAGRARRARPAPLGNPAGDTPGEILRRRYAAGEIDEDEYLRRLAGLSQR